MAKRTDMQSKANRNPRMALAFSAVIILMLLLLCGYLGYTTKALKESQEKIVCAHVDHIAKVDSIFYDMKEVILSNDSGTIANSPALLSQLHKDSALFRREVLLSQEEMNHLTSLHLTKIDSNYDQIGVWFGIASVVFLVFGFFGIFKIEENKREANNVLEEVKQKGIEATEVVNDVQSKASSVVKYLDGRKHDLDAFVIEKNNLLGELVKQLETTQSDSKEKLDSITKLLNEVQTKNEQYSWSTEIMQKQAQHLDELIGELNKVVGNNGEEEKA